MQLRSEHTIWRTKIVSIFLLILFLGYYSSITFFTHSHFIGGVTIVHSHPYKSENGKSSPNSQHSNKELQVIQLLSEYFTTAALILFGATMIRSLWTLIPVNFVPEDYFKFPGYCTFSLRAPPCSIPLFTQILN